MRNKILCFEATLIPPLKFKKALHKTRITLWVSSTSSADTWPLLELTYLWEGFKWALAPESAGKLIVFLSLTLMLWMESCETSSCIYPIGGSILVGPPVVMDEFTIVGVMPIKSSNLAGSTSECAWSRLQFHSIPLDYWCVMQRGKRDALLALQHWHLRRNPHFLRRFISQYCIKLMPFQEGESQTKQHCLRSLNCYLSL